MRSMAFNSTHASECSVDDAKVTDVFQWNDGSIFIVLDKAVGCGCAEANRAGFHKNDDEKFFISAGLTALVSGKSVKLLADNVNDTCPVHGISAQLTGLVIKSN